MRRLWLILLLLASFGAAHGEERPLLKVGLIGTPPFLLYEDGKPTGVDVRLWEDVATKLKVRYEFRHMETMERAMEAVARGEVDLVIGGIIITAGRERLVNFTQPYYHTGSAILSPAKNTAWDRLRPVMRKAFLYGVMALMGCLLVVGTLLWVAERRVNHLQFSSNPIKGIGTGVWLALVTISTVGYGDRVPVTLAGRVVAGSWMLISMLFVSSLVAGISSSLTVSQIGSSRLEKPEQLSGLRIATVRETYYETLVRRYTNRVVVRDNLDAAIACVLMGEADCVVYDLPALSYFLVRFPQEPLHLSTVPFESQNFGWAMRPKLPWQEAINVALLDEIESGRLEVIEREFLADR